MKSQHTLIGLVIVNCLVWFGMAANSGAPATAVVPVVRTHAFELVDSKGVIRASISVEEESGEAVFRLRDAAGEVRVKVGASKEGSGLVLLDDTTSPGLQVLAKRGATRLTMTNRTGAQRVIEP